MVEQIFAEVRCACQGPIKYALNDKGGIIKVFNIQCVPIKRKPVLSVGYLHCHARFTQTISFIIKGISLLSFDTKHMMISQCMAEKDLNSCMSKLICAE